MIFLAIIDLKTQLEQLVDEIEVESMLWMFLFIICMIGVLGSCCFSGYKWLGESPNFTDDCNIAADFNWYGGRRLALYRIPDSDCDWDYHTAL